MDNANGGNGDCTVHMSLQGKGGVGKSLASSVLAQYFIARGRAVRCIDADPVNKTLFQYRALEAKPLQLLHDGAIDCRAFDQLIEELLIGTGPFIVDNGASTFVPLWHYMLESDVLEILKGAGKRLFLHTVITGGQALADTITGFAKLAETTPDRSIVVWINEFFGRVEHDGKPFLEMKAFTDNEAKVCGAIGIPRRNYETFGRDVESVIAQKLTFEEAIRDASLSLMAKQRLKVVQRDLFEQLDRLSI